MPSPSIPKMRAAAAPASARLFRLRRCAVYAADFSEPLLKAELIEASDRQSRENANTLVEHPIRILERKGDFRGRTFGFRWIGNTPMRCHRLAGPERTGFPRSVVTNSENEVERRRAGLGELIPPPSNESPTCHNRGFARVRWCAGSLGPSAGYRRCRHGIYLHRACSGWP